MFMNAMPTNQADNEGNTKPLIQCQFCLQSTEKSVLYSVIINSFTITNKTNQPTNEQKPQLLTLFWDIYEVQ